jgi:Tfp pilus assembly major pilin PilA
VPELPYKRKYVRRKVGDKKKQDDGGTLPYAESASFSEQATDENDIPIATYVRQWKQSQGETLPTVKVESDCSDDSSESESEIPLPEMTLRQRGRRQGKMKVVSTMWSGT